MRRRAADRVDWPSLVYGAGLGVAAVVLLILGVIAAWQGIALAFIGGVLVQRESLVAALRAWRRNGGGSTETRSAAEPPCADAARPPPPPLGPSDP